MELSLYNPIDYYGKSLKSKHSENTEARFDSLAGQSGVDVESNRATVKEYKAKLAEVDKLERSIGKSKGWRVFLIVLTVFGGIGLLAGVIYDFRELWARLLTIVLSIAVIAASLTVIFKKLNPKIKHLAERIETARGKAGELLSEAWRQMEPLNASFDDEIPLRLIEKTLPGISFDKRFTPGRLRELKENYAFEDSTDTALSTLDTLSGSFLENPFLFERRRRHTMGTYIYRGQLLIRWTTYVRDKNGTRAVHHSQVLHASLEKPKPEYTVQTVLNYGAQAAPDLHFSRMPTDVENMNDKQVEKMVRRGKKKMEKKAKRALEKGGSFTEMANSDFDVIFGAHDRDHEQQFRLLFTPLAQVEMMKLMRSPVGYGDDFAFVKRGRHNIITSEHAQVWRMNTGASEFYGYDFDAVRQNFIKLNDDYFKSVYFDFAPLAAIPAYQDEPVRSMQDVNESSHFTAKEYETMANKIGAAAFAHPETATDVILKVAKRHAREGFDEVDVTAYSYRIEPRVDFVPTLGGDGRIHPVPVHWDEYIPITKTTVMDVCETDTSETSYDKKRRSGAIADQNPAVCYHGLYARSRADRSDVLPDIEKLKSQFDRK